MTTPQELEIFLQEKIPMAKSLGVRVVRADDASVELYAPLEINHNHMGTAFGGSLGAILILSGYTWLFRTLAARGHQVHVLLKTSHVEYKQPVAADVRALCTAPPPAELDAFFQSFDKKHRGRLHLQARVITERGDACLFRGEFVVQGSLQSNLEKPSSK